MRMYALVDFEDGFVEIVETSTIDGFDVTDWAQDKDQHWEVSWPTKQGGTEICAGVVVYVSDDRIKLAEVRAKYEDGEEYHTPKLGKGNRTAKRRIDLEVSSRKNVKKTRPSATGQSTPQRPSTSQLTPQRLSNSQSTSQRLGTVQSTLQKVKARSQQTQGGTKASAESEVMDLQSQVVGLQNEVKGFKDQMARMGSAIERMEELLQAGPTTPARNNPAPTAEPGALPDHLYTDKITKQLMLRCSKGSASKLTNDLISILYTTEQLPMLTVSDKYRKTNRGKTAMPREDLATVFGIVMHYFPYVTETAIKLTIRTKFNNHSQTHKKAVDTVTCVPDSLRMSGSESDSEHD